MSKDNAIIFLSEESLEALESSKAAIVLIKYPKIIESNNVQIAKLEKDRAFWMKMLEEEQKGIDAYNALPWIKRISKKHKLDKDAHVANLGNFAKDVAEIDSEIGELMMQNRDMKYEYDSFVSALLNVNVEPQEVIAEYHRIKDMLEKKARGEWVEPVAETLATVETPAAHEEAPAKVEVAPVREEPIAQNSKKVQRLSPREKFERRLAITAQKQAQNAQKAKQPGEE